MNTGTRTIRLGFCLLLASLIWIKQDVRTSAGLSTFEDGVAISGRVRDHRQRGVSGLFVRARQQATGQMTYVLTKRHGRFTIPGLDPGEYDLSVEARGWGAEPQRVTLSQPGAGQVTFDLKPVRIGLSQLTSAELLSVLPEGEGKDILLSGCTSCHTLQILTINQLDKEGWRRNVDVMRKAFGAPVPQGKEEVLADYLSNAFAVGSRLRRLAEQMPATHAGSAEVIYAAWDIPLKKALPHTATLDGRGNVWFTDAFGSRLGRLEIATGRFKTWNAPTPNSIPHGIVADKLGRIWFTERLQFDPANKIVQFDPIVERFTEFPLPQKISGPHTPIFDREGILWITEYEGNRIARFDPKTQKFDEYAVPTKGARPYGIDIDRNGVLWIAEIGSGSLGKLDPRTGRVVDYPTPTKNSGVRRVRADSRGRIWFTEFHGDRLGMFDPKTEKMTEYVMPGVRPQPYALEVTSDDKIWVTTWHQDVMLKFDPETKTFTRYAVPFLDLEVRDLRIDQEDRLWFVAMIPNKVVCMTAR